MPSIDTEQHFKFLLCCVKHSSGGKVNFDDVAEELQIVSKAAAAKRYERLLKAHDITPATPRKGAGAGKDDAKTSTSNKRKRGAAVKQDEEDEEGTPVKKERAAPRKVRAAVKKEESEEEVKAEDDFISE